jgi:hypothetical protein
VTAATFSKNLFRTIENGSAEVHKLRVPMGKAERVRECPASEALTQMAGFIDARADEPLIIATKKPIRDWIQDARDELAAETDIDAWIHVSMHDRRRTWATQTFYTLAYNGVPIGAEPTIGWGGWATTASGRKTFRENYLGPEPDWIAIQAIDVMELPV